MMKKIVQIIVIFAAAMLTGLFLILLFKTNSRQLSNTEKNVQAAGKQNKILIIDDNSTWPIFRGEPNLAGLAKTTLSDSIEPSWKFKTDGEVKSSPIIYGNLVFVGSADSNVYAIDLETGKKAWSYKTGDGIEASAFVVRDIVFIGSSDSFFYALDAKTGLLKWKYETGSKILGSANWIQSKDGKETGIILGSYDNQLYCFDANSGGIKWTFQTDSYINGTAAVENDKIIFGGCDAKIHIVSAVDGNNISSIDSGAYIAGSGAVSEGKFYVGNYENLFLKADIETGRILWRYTDSESPYFSSPAVKNDRVVIGGRDKRIHCLNTLNGKAVWTFQALGDVDSSPVICGDKVIVGCQDGRIYMIRLSDGSKLWSYETGKAIDSSPAVARGIVVIGCDDGYVYAFGTKGK